MLQYFSCNEILIFLESLCRAKARFKMCSPFWKPASSLRLSLRSASFELASERELAQPESKCNMTLFTFEVDWKVFVYLSKNLPQYEQFYNLGTGCRVEACIPDKGAAQMSSTVKKMLCYHAQGKIILGA